MTSQVRKQVLTEAIDLVTNHRNEVYDEPIDNFARIAAMWSAYLNTPITVTDVAALNILQKLSRLIVSPEHWDSWVDIAGYAACGRDVAMGRADWSDQFDQEAS